ncbi:mitochondrial sodium/calcium exchanger protein-like isoform X2 [Drosophila sulfurigaster albostrigata]|uniref:mitochondrial sodium/calcium exchanger protein-like isoform X2 n=1 Tax=Drosophila sulfurigaster albostrigata TaxID=89887 RepID=UPI002D2195FD|nr:mitochondrial sodium/calcium exchanger protein-like isoform X2 [Drosophila sulfurigaster albostrigata]
MTVLDDEFEYYAANLSCLSVLHLPYETRCMMVRKASDCQSIVQYLNYFDIMSCILKIDTPAIEILVMLAFICCVLIYVQITAIIVGTYLTPVMKILSVKMHMNEYLAGITLLSFANSFPDMISNLLPIRAQSALYTRTISNCLVIVLLCGGMVCFLKPFKMDGHSTVRDLLFLLMAVELMSFIITDSVSNIECIFMLIVYIIYLIIQVTDLILMRRTIRKLRTEITALRQQPISPARNEKLRKKMAILIDLESNEVMSIRKQDAHFMLHKRSSRLSSASNIFSTSGKKFERGDVDYVSTRIVLHNKNNTKNQFLWNEFFEKFNPIYGKNWGMLNRCDRIILIARAPLVIITRMIVPEVNYELYKHGWSKLLNCMQIVTTPFFVITAVTSNFSKLYLTWRLSFNMKYACYSMIATVPAAVFIFFDTRTDIPPSYHFIYICLNAASSFVIVFVCAAEIEVLTTIVGVVFDFSGNLMDITFGALINAILDMLAIYTMTMAGYEKMAFAAIFAGPFFSIIVGMGVPLYFNKKAHQKGSAHFLYGELGDNCYIFMMITVYSTLMWTLTLNFYSRRSVGIYCWVLLFIFLLYAFSIEAKLIHGFGKDPYFPPQ